MTLKNEKARAKRLMDNYKLTIAQWDKIALHQKGVCWGCGEPEPVKGRRLSTDHDWETGLVRGLLCSRCNPILGKLERAFRRYGLHKVPGLTQLQVLENLANYLKCPPAVSALGAPHYGWPGRTGTIKHRKMLRKLAKTMTLSKPPIRGSKNR
jgi:hypothetical protein